MNARIYFFIAGGRKSINLVDFVFIDEAHIDR